jgi:recombinational DNA repair protein (RecF pathway)
MREKQLGCSFLIVVFLLVSATGFTANTNSCVNCHTNDTLMKALYKPPAMPEGEGEG